MAENTDRNKSLQYSKNDVLSVSGEYGIVNQIALQGRSFAGVSVADYHVVETNDVVYTKSPLKANPYGIIKHNSGVPGIVSTLYAVYHPKSCAISQFIDYYFQNDLRLNKYLKPLVNIGAKHDMKINNEVALTGDVIFPSVDEQAKIVDFLKLIDEKIAKQKQLVEALKSYKRGVSTAIFSQKITIGKKGDLFPRWEKISIGDVFSERVERAVGDEELLAVTITGGVQKRSELDLKDNSSDDKSNYKVVCPGDLPYNTMRMWQGASGASPYKGIVSPAYTILRLNDPYNDDVWFWAAYFKERSMLNEFQKYSQGLTSDTWNLKYDQIKSIAIRRPCVDEQKLITRYLKTIDARINSHSAVLIALSKVKAFFLKEMFI